MIYCVFLLLFLVFVVGLLLIVFIYVEENLELMEEIVVIGSYIKSLEKVIDLKCINIGFLDLIVVFDIVDFLE